MLIKSAITESIHKTLADNNLNVKEKQVNIAIEKATGKVVDSIVQTTFYVATPENEIDKEALKQKLTTASLNAVQGMKVENSKSSLKALSDAIARATFPLVKEEKLNLRYNYENDILMFTLLGILSFLFAWLLKREDKKKGYGLELPNMEK